MRRADADADGAHVDGTNGADAAGVKGEGADADSANGEGTDADGVNGGSGGGGVNVDSARGTNTDCVRGVGARSANAN